MKKSLVNPQALTTDQHQQIIGFSLVLTTLQKHASKDDKVAVDYVSQFYSYFCNHYEGYSFLPEEAKLSFQVANFSDSESFMRCVLRVEKVANAGAFTTFVNSIDIVKLLVL